MSHDSLEIKHVVEADAAQEEDTHFGFQTVPKQEKARHVGRVFDSVASRYDVMNDLMSLGLHRVWKRIAIEYCAARAGMQWLDIAAGSGDLVRSLARRVGNSGQVVALDINAAMLAQGRERLTDKGVINNVAFCQADAQCLPFPDDYFDGISIGFGLRNVTDQALALSEMYRVLKPGGKCVILEFSRPVMPGLSRVYDQYSFKVLPRLGRLVAGDAESYQYLAESIRMHPDQKTLLNMMQAAQFESCEWVNMAGGIVAIHHGRKY